MGVPNILSCRGRIQAANICNGGCVRLDHPKEEGDVR